MPGVRSDGMPCADRGGGNSASLTLARSCPPRITKPGSSLSTWNRCPIRPCGH